MPNFTNSLGGEQVGLPAFKLYFFNYYKLLSDLILINSSGSISNLNFFPKKGPCFTSTKSISSKNLKPCTPSAKSKISPDETISLNSVFFSVS